MSEAGEGRVWQLAAALLWLALCALLDIRRRRVGNRLTLVPLAAALGLRLAGLASGGSLEVLTLAVLALAGWRLGLLGGADAKAALALAVFDPRLGLWAWLGLVPWLACHRLLVSRSGPRPGFPGFLLGALVWVCLTGGRG